MSEQLWYRFDRDSTFHTRSTYQVSGDFQLSFLQMGLSLSACTLREYCKGKGDYLALYLQGQEMEAYECCELRIC